MPTKFKIIILVCMLINPLKLIANPENFPVVWVYPPVLKSLQEIPALLASTSYPESEVDYSNEKKQTVMIKTCQQYFNIAKSGYYPHNNISVAAQSFFVNRCEPLKFLQQALPAKRSFIRSFDIRKDYGLLPAQQIFPSEHEERNGSIAELFSDVEVISKSKNSIEIKSKKAQRTALIQVIAWGDYNHNGDDDMLIFIANYAYDYMTSYHDYFNAILTRKEAQGKIIAVDSSALKK